jgi:hypothetical protein
MIGGSTFVIPEFNFYLTYNVLARRVGNDYVSKKYTMQPKIYAFT